MPVYQIQALQRETLEIIMKRKKWHGHGIRNKTQESQTQADQQTWGRIYVYDPALPPRPLLHTEMCAYPTDHTLPDLICLKARSCVYHSLHPALRNICEQTTLFSLCFLYEDAYTVIYSSRCTSVRSHCKLTFDAFWFADDVLKKKDQTSFY